ncbi:histidyl-tRNA synthetase [Alkaliphilus metalliredigens QYMF]|uniref:Histidine--tRNA ligase n=1 Tax=Alkaliphilus metalliredigens (strain QYMF) TaxID=293826 RepID=A6TQ62_ALKMQ|nr:histidine--tRNA ligase [Alkaliphilus metalliredigens]ABR48330.1 histidyl-tRNA synthetase [Alkaliphilus metalliredigens QYMF]
MDLELKNVKGTKDFFPNEQIIRNGIIKKLQEVFELYGYQPLETPTLYYLEVLASKYAGGAEILKETYSLKDQGERELGLRYDLTIPFSKVIGMNPNLRMPFKRYEIGKVFRDGPVKLGRMREFIQCDVDVVGVKSMMAEAELMFMATEVFDKLGLDIYLSYNNRKLLSGTLMKLKINKELASDVILSLDKVEKIGIEGVKKELLEKNLQPEVVENIIELLNNKEAASIDYYKGIASNSLMQEGIQELEELNDYLDAMGIGSKVKYNPFLARGLEIYTGTVYEIFLKDGSITSSMGAGGRYDDIIGKFIQNEVGYPAVGISFGLDVIYTALSMKRDNELESNLDVYIIPLGTEAEALKMACELRGQGIKVDIDMTERKLKKRLDYANKEKIPYVLILGEDEVKSQRIKMKDMKSGTEEEMKISEIGNNVLRRIQSLT